MFPFGLRAERLEELEVQITDALHNTENLEALHWTRTGSLNNRLLLTMFDRLQRLQKLEITGNSRLEATGTTRTWSPGLLVEKVPKSLRQLSIVLPDRMCAQMLVPLAAKLEGQLDTLSVLSLDSPVITDAMLAELAVYTPRLRRLALVGCKHVQGPGVQALVSAAGTEHLRELALEGLPLVPGMLRSLAPFAEQLRSLTLTYPTRTEDLDAFYDEFAELVGACRELHSLVYYARGGSPPVLGEGAEGSAEAEPEEPGEIEEGGAERVVAPVPTPAATTPSHAATDLVVVPQAPHRSSPALSARFTRHLVFSRAARTLRILRIHGIAVPLHQLQMLALSILSDRLEELAIHIYEGDLETLKLLLGKLRALRTLHLLSHLRSDANFTEEQVLEIAGACAPGLTQIGFRNRVWLVERQFHEDNTADVSLRRWDMAAGVFPEAMLVVRS